MVRPKVQSPRVTQDSTVDALLLLSDDAFIAFMLERYEDAGKPAEPEAEALSRASFEEFLGS